MINNYIVNFNKRKKFITNVSNLNNSQLFMLFV